MRTGMVWVALIFAAAPVPGVAAPASGQAGARDAEMDSVPIVGVWRGELETPQGPLLLVLTIEWSGSELSASLSAPERGLSDLPLVDVDMANDGTFRFRFPADGASYEGNLDRTDGSARLHGVWTQRGQNVVLDFERAESGDAPQHAVRRPQTPVPPFPYRADEVTVEADLRLACTLARPPREGAEGYPAAVLLSVAGPNDRDQTHSGHRPFAVLADYLARRGVATLRCDDRGVGGSEGELLASDFADLTKDALAAVDTLRALEGVDPRAVGIIGNSEGSVVAARAAASSDVAFIVLLGGAGVPGADVIAARRQMEASAHPDSLRPEGGEFDRLVELVQAAEGVGLEEATRSHPDVVDSLRALLSGPGIRPDPMLPPDPEAQLRIFLSPWYHDQITANGGRLLRTLGETSVLAITGSLDRVNLPSQNLPAIQRALLEAGNRDHTVALLPGLNHVMQEARTGYMREYGELESTFAPLALETIAHWIGARFGPEM